MANVCEVLLDVLVDAGVKYIFAIPGGAINTMLEAIRKQDKIKLIHVRHEEGAAFAASAIGKLTGELAVCMGTSGPGAIHLLNGLYDARTDNAPVLSICGQAETRHQGVEYMQDVRLDRLFSDVALYNAEIENPEQMPRVAEEACRTAINYKGVANLILPADIAAMEVKAADKRTHFFVSHSIPVPPKEDFEQAISMLNKAEKVAILAGYGARHARKELLLLAETLKAPIIKPLRGKDVVPDEHPLSLGGIGLLGTTPSVHALDRCDLLLIAGSNFPYFDFYPEGKTVIQIDINPQRIGNRVPVHLGLVGDCQNILSQLGKLVDEKKDSSYLHKCQDDMKDWWKKIAEDETKEEVPIHPQMLANLVGQKASDDAIFCCDTGNVTVWCARHLKIRGSQQFTLSGGMASMAFGLPAAIGAKLMYPDRQVFALCGDGGFTMLMGEFSTAVQYKLPIVVIVFNNGKLGMIQMEQEEMGYPEFGIQLLNPDFALFAKACGGDGETVVEPGDIGPALDRAIASQKPYLLDVMVNPGELTIPPKIEFKQALGYAKAKVLEFMGEGDKKK